MNKIRAQIAKLLVCAFMFTSVFMQYGPVFAKEGKPEVQKDKVEILVKYKNDSKSDTVKDKVKKKLKINRLESKTKHKRSKVEVVEIDQGDDIDKVIAELKKDPEVQYAQKNYKLSASAEPTDSRFEEQWGLKNEGQAISYRSGTKGVDISALTAWKETKGAASVLVGVLDTGIDITHKDLKNNIYTNTNETPGNGIDDDGNGYIDDMNGWDFAAGDSTVYDGSTIDAHGTHIAGIIAAGENGEGVIGVAPSVSILPLKFINGTTGYTSDAIEAIEYASKMGVKIMNCSFGGQDYNQALKDAMASSDMLFVCAAGNNAKDMSESPVYPASFGLPNQITAAAADNRGYLAAFSNYGTSIDTAAPGVAIMSTTPGNGYGYMSGTSMAAPFVSGIAALVKSSIPDMTPGQLAARIRNTVTKISSLQGKVKTGGMANAYRALTNTDPAAEEDNTGRETNKDTGTGIDNDSVVQTNAAVVDPKLLEQIHYGESGVSVSTGNFSRSYTDMSLVSPGFTVNISRTYNSKDDRATSTMGRGWTFGFEGSFKQDTTNTSLWVAKLPNGGAQMFVKNADGTYQANDSRSTLIKNTDGTHTLTTKDQYTYTFNTNGYLAEMKDRNGNAITIASDNTGKVQSITDAVGRQFTVTYDTNGLITKVTDVKGGRYVQYNYDTAKKILTSVSEITGTNVTTPAIAAAYEYDAANYLTTVWDRDKTAQGANKLDQITYDHATTHKVTQHTDSYGNTYTYTYDTAASKTTITDKNNRIITKKYDTAFYVTESTDPEGKTSTVEYYLDENNYNKYGEEKKITDRNGNITEYIRDAKGNITKIVNPDLSYSEYQYDEKSNLIMEKDETGRTTFYKYDAAKINLVKKVQPLNGTEEYSETADQSKYAVTRYIYYTDEEAAQLGCKAKGLLKMQVDPEGNATKYTYDADGNQKTITDPEGNITTNTYNAIGWLTSTVSPGGSKTSYHYDLNGRLVRTELDEGETTRTVYDPMGRKTQEISPNQYSPSEDGLNDAAPVQTYRDKTTGTKYTYHPHGQLRTRTDAKNNTTSYEYDLYGNTVKETRPDGSVKTYEYDIMNRLKKVYFKDSDTAAPVLLEEYTYTILTDKKTKKTYRKYINSNDNTNPENYADTQYTYDFAERLVEQKNPDGGRITTVYNGNGTVYSTTDANGGATYYKYDGLGRPAEKWTQTDNGYYSYTATTYDKAGNKKQEKASKDKVELFNVPAADRLITKTYTYYADGTLKMVTDSSGRKTIYQYDSDGNLAREDVYTNAAANNTTVYQNNHLGKPVTKTVYIKKGDLYGNSFDNTEAAELITTYRYDKNGNLTKITTADGVTTTYTYDSLNRQTGTSKPGLDENGLPVIITTATEYDWEGKVIKTTDPNGNITENTYNKRGFLTHVKKTGTDGDSINFFDYDTAGRKTAEVSPENYTTGSAIKDMNRTEYTYDKMDRVKTKKETYKTTPGAIEWTSFVSKAYQYDPNGNITKELDGEGYKFGVGTSEDAKIQTGYGTEYTYNYMNQNIAVIDPVSKDAGLDYTVKLDYDGAGRKTSETNAKGVVTSYYYDDAGNITATTVRKTESDPELTIKTNTYDLCGNMLTQTDGNGNRTTYQYNALGEARKITYPGDTTIPENTVTFQYDVMGNLVKKQDTAGATEQYTYDSEGRVLTQTRQDKDGKQSITTSASYDKNGNKRFETDGNGTTKENRYDGFGRLVKTGILSGETLKHPVEYRYDKNGNLTRQTDWRGNTTESIYDPINRVVEKKDAYRTIQKLEYDASHKQTKSYDAKNNATEYTYDRDNRLISTKDPEGHITKQSYDEIGNVETKTDGRGKVTTYQYDQFGRLSFVINANNEKTSYAYDLCGNLVTQTDGKGNTTTYEYNTQNKQVKKTDHGGKTEAAGKTTYDPAKTESYTYYANGLMATKTDRNGKVTVYLYDIHGRIVSKAINKEAVTYTYDNNGNQLSMTDASGTTRRTYDEYSRVTTKSVPKMGTMTFRYDIIPDGTTIPELAAASIPAGSVAEKTKDTKGHETTKVYDGTGKLKYVIADGKTTTYDYDENGNRKSVTYPDKPSEEYQYDKDNKLTVLVNKNKDGEEIDRYEYKYDEAHNQTEKTETINKTPKGTTKYQYDSLNRLMSVEEPNNRQTAYTFDKAGNRQTEKITSGSSITLTTYSYNEQNRLISTVEETGDGVKKKISYTYDNNGNMTRRSLEQTRPIDPANPPKVKFGMFIEGQKDGATENAKPIVAGTASYEYDVWNQMTKATTGDGTTRMQYNGDGYRVEKNENGQVTRYLLEADKVVLETDGNGRETARNVYGTNLLARTMGADTYYYMYNGHADVTALLKTDGSIAASYYYDAFGNKVAEGTNEGGINNPFRYSGYQWDSGSGLYYLNARYYDSKIARFLTEDTYRGNMADPLSLNLYTYCLNNPIIYNDPTGHKANKVIDKGDKGDKVVAVQERLLALDYSLGGNKATGNYQGYTEKAVKQFQKDNKLPVTGVVDNRTWAVLNAAYITKDEPDYRQEAAIANAKTVKAGNISSSTVIMSDKAHDNTIKEIKQARNSTGNAKNTVVKTEVKDNKVTITGVTEKKDSDKVKQGTGKGNSGVSAKNVVGKTIKSTVEGTFDAMAGSAIAKLPSTSKSVTSIPSLGAGMEVETITSKAGTKALKGAIKIAGPVAVASYGYDVYQDINKYDGTDAAKAVAVTTLGTGLTIAAGVACTGVGAPVGAAIAVGVVVGVGVGIVGDKVKEWWIGY